MHYFTGPEFKNVSSFTEEYDEVNERRKILVITGVSIYIDRFFDLKSFKCQGSLLYFHLSFC